MRTILLISCLVAAPVAIVGCASTPDMASLAGMNPSQLMSGYTSKLGDLGGVLSGVTDAQSAATALPKAKELVSGMGSYASQINGLPPGQIDSLMKQYGSQLDPAMTKVDDQIARLAKQPTYGSGFSTLLKSLPRVGA